MGDILDTPAGQLKDMIVDRVEGLETTLAHMVPEMTANLLIPICLLVYLFVLDWRMALVSLITLPVGMAFVSVMARTYPAKYEGSVQVSRQMTNAQQDGRGSNCWLRTSCTGAFFLLFAF